MTYEKKRIGLKMAKEDVDYIDEIVERSPRFETRAGLVREAIIAYANYEAERIQESKDNKISNGEI